MSSPTASDPKGPASGGADAQQRRNARVAVICAFTFVAMVGMAFASVPLYRAFCQVTGFGGVTGRSDAAPDKVLDRKIEVRFDANVRELPWKFEALQTSQSLKIGETGLAFFRVTNTSDQPVTGHAVYNVVPTSAGAYFQKMQCFCFSDQTIGPGRTVEFPVLYFIDPKYAEDFETKGEQEVTLSYTFYPAKNGSGEAKVTPASGVSALGGSQPAGL